MFSLHYPVNGAPTRLFAALRLTPAGSPSFHSGVLRNLRLLVEPVTLRSQLNGAPDTIRTCDLTLRRGALYPAELRGRFLVGKIDVLHEYM